jgi:hypothetical protein
MSPILDEAFAAGPRLARACGGAAAADDADPEQESATAREYRARLAAFRNIAGWLRLILKSKRFFAAC